MGRLSFSASKLASRLVCLCAGALFAWGVVLGILSHAYSNPPHGGIFLHIIIIMLALRVIFYNRHTAAAILAAAAFAALLFIYNVSVSPALAADVERTWAFMRSAAMYVGGFEQYTPAYEAAVTLALSVAVALLAFIFICLRGGVYILLLIAAGTYGIILSSGGFLSGLPFTACMAGLLILLVVRFHAGGRFARPAEAAGMAALVLLCVGAAHLIPVPAQGFAGAAVDAIHRPLNAAGRRIGSLFAPRHFSLSSTGFMRNDRILGGDVELTGELVMKVSAGGARQRLYLAGAFKDNYTGYSWENTLGYYCPFPPNTDLLERMFANMLLSLEHEFEYLARMLAEPSRFARSHYAGRAEYIPGGTLTIQMQKHIYPLRKAEINFLDTRTFTVFTAEIATGVEKGAEPLAVYRDAAGNLAAQRLMGRNSPYTIYFRSDPPVQGFNMIKDLSRRGVYREIYAELQRLREVYGFDERQISALLDASLSEDLAHMHMFKMYPPGEQFFDPEISVAYVDFLRDVLIPRADKIHEVYTRLPASLPQRVVDLALEITDGMENTVGKAGSINRFLRNYPYTLTPGDTPEGRDFVDYFLFDLQKGYCTYFATAFVILCRAVGIPARYVEGFVTPRDLNDDGAHEVRDEHAHAWAEIYLEGYGWSRFDPTPAADSAGRPAMLPSAEDFPLADYGGVLTVGLFMGGALEPETDAGIAAELNYGLLNMAAVSLIAAVLAVLLAFIAYILIRWLISRAAAKKIAGKPNNEAAFGYYQIISKYLKFFNHERSPHETVVQFAARIDAEINGMNAVAGALSEARYGHGQASLAEMRWMIADLDEQMRRSAGRVGYIIYRFKNLI